MTNNSYLAHYGVLGMKWGVRRRYDGSSANSRYRKRQLTNKIKGSKGPERTKYQNKLTKIQNKEAYKKDIYDIKKEMEKNPTSKWRHDKYNLGKNAAARLEYARRNGKSVTKQLIKEYAKVAVAAIGTRYAAREISKKIIKRIIDKTKVNPNQLRLEKFSKTKLKDLDLRKGAIDVDFKIY